MRKNLANSKDDDERTDVITYSHYAPIDDIRPYHRTKPYNERSLTTFIDNYVASEARSRTQLRRDYTYYGDIDRNSQYYHNSRRPYTSSSATRLDKKVVKFLVY